MGADQVRRMSFVQKYGWDWQPAIAGYYAAEVIVPEFRAAFVGLPITPAIDAQMRSREAEHIDYLRSVDVRMTARLEHWRGSHFTGPLPIEDWLLRPIADVLRFEHEWFGNNIRLYLWLGSLRADVAVFKSM